MNIQFGLETEIGITRENSQGIDVVRESINLVRSASAPGVRMRWNYSNEDPHLDARGFRVQQLKQDKDEAHYFAQDVNRRLSFKEIKSDYILKNGARFYNDHAHPEYCTPECSNPVELLQQDHDGDEILMSCLRTINQKTDNPVILYKNNTDFQGHSYGCHENYLLPRSLAWDRLAQGIQGFLVTRQIYCGSGKFGWEEENRFLQPGFQISQRSDFFSVLQSVDTMQRRPIVNTRDEPHADPSQHRRFHVIIGDANMSPYATWLKVGSTALVLQALVNGAPFDKIPRLRDPISALKAISRDPDWKWLVKTEREERSTALTVQKRYLDLVDRYVEIPDDSWRKVQKGWARILQDLETDPLLTCDRIDWAAKYKAIESFRAAENLDAGDPWLKSLDLAYHRMDKAKGLYFGLFAAGELELPYSENTIAGNNLNAPQSTRAALRGLCIEKFGPRVESAQWDGVELKGEKRNLELDFRGLFSKSLVAEGLAALYSADSVEDLASLPFARVI